MNFPGYAAYLVDGFGNYSEHAQTTPMGIVSLIQQNYLDISGFTDEDLYVLVYYNQVEVQTHHFPANSYLADVIQTLMPN